MNTPKAILRDKENDLWFFTSCGKSDYVRYSLDALEEFPKDWGDAEEDFEEYGPFVYKAPIEFFE